jgi:hypothetical protein
MKAYHEELENIFLGFKILVKKYPNDADLGAEVRKIIKLAMKNERTFRT